ncbi:MAG: hypothetical protein J2P44_02415 [Candidatus Dormibacteraeota bacterium]|nr:hypothetical protein [Candidatus Dormibacteraeota bacterium]
MAIRETMPDGAPSGALPRPYLVAGVVAVLLVSVRIPLLGSDRLVTNASSHVLAWRARVAHRSDYPSPRSGSMLAR